MVGPGKGRGLTLIELVVTILVAGILIAIAIPSFNQMFQKNRLKGAAERLAAETQLARAEALARREPITVSITAGTDWCLGLDEGTAACDCSVDDVGDATACTLDGVLRVSRVADFEGVRVQGNDVSDTFEPIRGRPEPANYDPTEWPVIFESAAGQEVGVRLTVLGSVHLCSPAGSGNIWDYPPCN